MTTNETPLVERIRALADKNNGASIGDLWNGLDEAADEIERLRIGHDRYEKVRKLHPQAYAELWQRSIRGEGRFDDLVDQSDAAGK